ncbi:MAG: hypothetical protein LBR23_08285, partial [Spirochaetaceae bacterium]|nr:hypothetical protein [Spirochaetaceae bacterium]
MKCQSKTCLQEIPDDSCFCDQCGVQLLKCTKCGAITLGKFCNKCGGPTAAISPAGAGAPGPTSRPTVPAPA